ncbi:MAG TPA: TetR/AcrR family transcriptional regulator [Actinomycetota bacterium]
MASELSRRERKKIESKQRLVDCAAALFTCRGYNATPMEYIGECADVSRATVFNYFPRKEDLVLAWFDSRRADLADVLAEDKGKPDDAPTRLRAAFRALARIFEDDPETGRGMMRAWLQAGGPLLTPDSETTSLLADVVRAGKDRGEVTPNADPGRAGRLLFDAYIGVLYRWVTTGDEQMELEEDLLAALDLVLDGIAPPTAQP